MKDINGNQVMQRGAFTLVELIVVITIVGILATVGFVSYSGYLIGSRDSNRISQLTKLSDSLQVYAASKTLPLPDNKIDITSSGTVIAYQGYIGADVLEVIDYTNGGKDPKDDSYFTYMLSGDRKSFQILAFMEDSVAFTPLTGKTYAADYSNRYPLTYGHKLGVLTDLNNTPLQELSLSGTTFDILNTTLTLKSFLSGTEYVVDNLSTLPQLQELISQKGQFWKVVENRFVSTKLTGWRLVDPNCPVNDLVIGEQTWAGCNSTLGDGFEWGRQNNGTNGTIAECQNYDGVNNASDPDCAANNPLMLSTANPKDFFDLKQPGGANSFGDAEYDTIWGKLYTWDQAMGNAGFTGACREGWRVPTDAEWDILDDTITAQNGGSRSGYDGIGWQEHSLGGDADNVANALKTPLTGWRAIDGITFYERGEHTTFWSSSSYEQLPGDFRAPTRDLYYDYDSLDDFNRRLLSGYSVRCIKN